MPGPSPPAPTATTAAQPYELLRDVATIALLHAAACITARGFGFDHVSDDDFARVTIAQTFAHAPKLDPSGTSWLPFPFWILGGLMAIVGRSLAMARGLSIGLAAIFATAPYLALRFAKVPRHRALFATAFAFGTPWALWLGATTVPESFTASLTAAAAIGLAAVAAASVSDASDTAGTSPSSKPSRASRFAPWLFALAALAACLSRYEAWPIAAVIAIVLVMRALRAIAPHTRNDRAVSTRSSHLRVWLFAAALCAAGPLAWMAWNAHAHDGPLHFFRRVSSFKRAIDGGDASTSTLDAFLLYPKLFFTSRPEVAVSTLLLLPSLRDPNTRRRWGLPLLCAAAQIIFLAYGNARDGAAAHHPERALLGTTMIFALFVGDVGLADLQNIARAGRIRTAQIIAAGVLAIWATWVVRGTEIPGRGPSENRTAQMERGEKLKAEGVAAIAVTPCGFEHFALLAAYGSPESATVAPRTGVTPTPECPHVEH